MTPEDVLIIGVDPGKAVGIALLDGGEFNSREFTYADAEDELARLCETRRKIILGVERFVITQRTMKMTRQYDALYLIGVCKFLARRYELPCLLQGASEAQRAGNGEVLRAFGWWRSGTADHVARASAQAALVLARMFPDVYEQLLSPGMIVPSVD